MSRGILPLEEVLLDYEISDIKLRDSDRIFFKKVNKVRKLLKDYLDVRDINPIDLKSYKKRLNTLIYIRSEYY